MKKLFIISFALALTSCSKSFLDRTSLTSLSAGNFWKTEQDAFLAINGVYDVLQDRVMYSGNLNGTAGLPQYDCFSDNMFGGYKFEGPGAFMEANVDPSNGFFSGQWNSLYKGIGRANAVLENIEKIPASAITDANKKSIRGQALFLRAMFNMHLAIYFGEAPLVLKVQSLEESYVTKNSYLELSAQVTKDLTEAVDLLPATQPAAQYGYATKGAALGMLARFQLYNKDYQGVVATTAQIMTLGYTLNASYPQLFTEAGEFSKEIIFSVRFNQDVTANNETFSATFLQAPRINTLPMPNLVNDYYCTDGRPITTSPLYRAATPKLNRDPRLLANVHFVGDIFLTDINRAFTGNTATRFGQKKYIRDKASATGIAVFSPGGQDFIVLRYADILLMRAEALVELNQLTEVYTLVNQVRARVSMPTVAAAEGTGLSQTALRNIVRHERRVELAFEGLRFYDLKRWGTMQQAFTTIAADRIAGYVATFRGEKSTSFPIPLAELNANNKLVQNTAWQ